MTSTSFFGTLAATTALTIAIAGPAAAQSAEPAEGAETISEAGSTAPTAEISADLIVAKVGTSEITLGDVIAIRQSLPQQYQQLPDEVLLTGIVEQISEQILLESAARDTGLAETPRVQSAIQNQVRAVLADAYMTQALEAEITKERVEAAYKERFLDAEPVVEVRAAHILVEDEVKAVEIKKQIDDGADFAAMAAEHGTDGTAARGGDLGWFVRGQMVPEFADAAFAMESGQISDPVETPFGWHLIKLDERRNQPVAPIDDVRSGLIEELSQEVSTEVLDALREKAEVTRMLDGVPPEAIRADDLIAN